MRRLILATFGLLLLCIPARAQQFCSPGTNACIYQNQTLSGTTAVQRVVVSGATAPTRAFTSGGGTSPSCALGPGSSDSAGTVVLTTGTGAPGNTGTATLTFSAALGVNAPVCIFMPYNGASAWNARAATKGNTITTASAVFSWDNNAVALSVSTTYGVVYHCIGK